MHESYSLYSKEKLIGLLNERDQELELLKEQNNSTSEEKKRLEFNLCERIKELKCHNFISELMIQEDLHQDYVLQQIAGIIPPSWQFPDICQAAITINGKQYKTKGFASSRFQMIKEIESKGKIIGNIEVTYPVDEMPNCEQIFLDEEFVLLKGISERISHYVEKNNFDSELKQNEEKYRLLVENQNELVVKVDPEGKFTYVSPTYCKLFGKTEEELLGKSYFPMIHPDDVEPTEKAVATLAQSPHTCYIEQRAMTIDGWKWLAWSDRAILDNNGNIGSIIGVGRDIDYRKKVELSLQKSEAIHRTILNASPDGICFASLEGKIIMVSSNLLKMFGYTTVEEMQDEFIYKYVTNESAEIAKTNIKNTLEGTRKGSGVYTGIKKDGTKFEFEANASIVKDNEGNPLNQIIILRDITERIKSQEELIASERRYRNIFENVQDVYFETNLEGIILEMTPSISVMSKGMYTRESMVGASVGNLYANPDERKGFIELLQKHGRVNDYELVFKIQNNEIKHLSTTAVISFNSEGKPEKIYGTMRDVTERKKAETEIRKFRTIAEQANYSVGIADLNGILTYVNKAFAESHGYEANELIGKPLSIVHNEEQLKMVMPLVEEIKTKGGFASQEVWHTRKDGSVYPTLMNAALIKDEDGKPLYISSTAIDITELKKSQELLIRSEADLNLAQEIARMGSWDFDLLTGNYTWSKNNYFMLGMKPFENEISVEFFFSIVHPEDRERLESFIQQVVYTQKQNSIDVRIILPDGNFMWIQNNVVPIVENNQVVKLKGVNIDITDKKNDQEKIIELNATLEERIKLRTQELSEANIQLLHRTEELENFFTLSLDLLCIGDLEGNLLKVSKSWEKMLGYPLEEIQNSSFFKYVHPEDVDNTLEGLKEIGNNPNAPHFLINRHVTSDGNSIYLEWQTFPIGNLVYAAGRDVTERFRAKQFEQELLNLTPKLTGIPFNEINDAINLSLQRIGSFMKADRAYIFEMNHKENTWSNTFEWCAEGIEPQIEYLQDYSLDESPEFSRMLTNLEDIVIPSVKDMPESLQAERNMLEPQGIKSLVIVPITNENNLIGFIGLDSVESYRKFSKMEINTLRVFGNMLASLINHRKQEEIIEQTRINYETFFNTIDDFLIIAGEEGVIIDSNKTVENRLGYTKNEIIGHNILMGYPEESYAEVIEMSFKNREGLIDSFSIPIKTKNGELIPVETRLKRGLWNGKPSVFCVSKDISAIKLSEQKFASAFHSNAAIMSITTVAEGKFIDVNNAFLKTFEYTFDEVKGKTVFDLNLYEDVDLRKQITKNVQNNISVKDVEMQMTTHFGKRITGLFSADLIYIGNISCLLVTIIDITERKKTELEITRQAGLITSLLDSIPDIIFYKDINGVYLGCNPPFAELVSKSKSEVIGKTDYDLFDKETADSFRVNDKAMLEQLNPRHNEEWITYPDGRTILIDTLKTTYNSANGELIGVLGISRDITERKKAEEQIRISQERLSNVIEATNVGTWEWEVQTGKAIFNENWASMIGYNLEELSPVSIKTWRNFAHPDDLEKSDLLLKEVFEKNCDTYDVDVRIKHKNGEWIWIQDKGRVLNWSDDGKPLKMSGTHTDISARKKAEEDLIRARNEAEQANRAKSEFLSRMSHELRTPMNSILGFAQLLEMGELNTGQKKGVNHIIKSGKHLLNLINEVLDISRIEAGRLSLSIEPVQVNRVINEIIDLVKPMTDEKQLTVNFRQPDENLYFVKADVQRLKQVLVNLLNNAIKYNRPSGSIVITINPSANEFDTTYMYRISIIDTGVGIPENNLDKLFNPFERIGLEKSNIEGTGLGLAVVKKLTEAMNGRIGVESKPGVGSTFWIELPHADSSPINVVTENIMDGYNPAISKKGVILYIEDNLSNIELVEQILLAQRPEIKLITSQYGMETLNLAVEHNPDVILLDLNLPDIHGLEALKQIIQDERVKSIPVVVVSADAMPNQINRLLQAGAVDYLPKPIDVSGFLAVVDKYISKSHSI